MTPGLFEALGVAPVCGRAFSPSEGAAGANRGATAFSTIDRPMIVGSLPKRVCHRPWLSIATSEVVGVTPEGSHSDAPAVRVHSLQLPSVIAATHTRGDSTAVSTTFVHLLKARRVSRGQGRCGTAHRSSGVSTLIHGAARGRAPVHRAAQFVDRRSPSTVMSRRAPIKPWRCTRQRANANLAAEYLKRS